ncbi:MAG: DUF2066 domain-containing protein [Halioglobus sp.]|nr:DUF2066 domain-containing protein [Halioglobus sp.]
MRSKPLLVLCLFSVLVSGLNVRADMVADLYSATVSVADQGSSALAGASRRGLSDVLIKVTGSRAVLKSPVAIEALQSARGQVQRFAYVRGKPPEPPLSVRVEFDSVWVMGIVRQSGAPLWTANRPVVLAWVVMEGTEGKQFVTAEGAPDQADLLRAAFSRRGVPLQLPVFDLADMAALTPDAAWRLDSAVLSAASARYNVDHVVAARMTTLTSGETTGDWSYQFQGERINRSLSVPGITAFYASGAGLVADEMAARYAVLPRADGEGEILMVVSGVTSYADYASVVRFLEDLELVEAATVLRVQGSQLELSLQASVDAAQLANLIALNDRLLPWPAAGTTAELSYQWRN